MGAQEAVPALAEYYDEIWVYGLPQICDPLAGLRFRGACASGWSILATFGAAPLDRKLPQKSRDFRERVRAGHPGGGGDGEALIHLVLSAYEYDRALPLPALLVWPFHASRATGGLRKPGFTFTERTRDHFQCTHESLMARAAGIVAMGGYNTFCEILSFDKRALIVPGTAPRLEQLIRAQRASDLGL